MLTAYYPSQWHNGKSWQAHIPMHHHIERPHDNAEIDEHTCYGVFRLAFVVHEDIDRTRHAREQEFVCRTNDALHDVGTFAVYICGQCGCGHVQWVQA